MIYQIFPERFAIGKPFDIKTKLEQPAYRALVSSGMRPGTTNRPVGTIFLAATSAALSTTSTTSATLAPRQCT